MRVPEAVLNTQVSDGAVLRRGGVGPVDIEIPAAEGFGVIGGLAVRQTGIDEAFVDPGDFQRNGGVGTFVFQVEIFPGGEHFHPGGVGLDFDLTADALGLEDGADHEIGLHLRLLWMSG